jgi:Fur family peroxide stress response transcriptional regulator
MSFATVYNTLDALAKAGLAGIVRLPGKRGDAARFDPNTEPHHHAVCDACGAVLDIAAGTLAPTPGAVKKLRRTAPGFHVHAVERIYRGLCGRCTASRS